MAHPHPDLRTSAAGGRWWTVPLVVAGVAVTLGALVLQPLGVAPEAGARATWVAIQQVAIVVLAVLAWHAPQLNHLRTRVIGRASAVALGLQLATSVWNNQLGGSYRWYGTTVDDVVRGGLTLATGIAAVVTFAAITRQRGQPARRDVAAVVDALVVSAAVGVVMWELLTSRTAAADVAVGSIAIATAFVVALTAVSVRLLLSPARRTVALRLLAMTLVCGSAATVRFAIAARAGLPPRDTMGEVALLAAFAVFVAALLHPSMREADGGAEVRRATGRAPLVSDGMLRAAVLCVATIVPATVTLVRAVSDAVAEGAGGQSALTVPSAAAGVVITIGVAWRLAQLVRDRERARVLLEHRSRHDDLTGLPNRAYLLEALDHHVGRLRAAGPAGAPGFGLMFLDLDGFKAINDNYGHHAGDTVLVTVAQRLADVVRTDDLVARMAGDEFVLLCAAPADAPSLGRLADRIRDMIEAPMPADFGVVTPRVSIGTTAVDHAMAAAPDAVSAILRRADDAMYEAKREGRAAAASAPARATPPQPPTRDTRRGDVATDVDRVG